MPARQLLIIGLIFNVYWFLAVIGQGQFVWLLAILLLACWWRYQGTWRFGLMLGATGVLMDLMLSWMGLYTFAANAFPIWLVLLWIGFGSFIWIMRQTIVANSPYIIVMLGGIGGTMSYFAGYRFGAVMWPLGIEITLICILVCWLCFSVLVLALLNRCNRQQLEGV